MRQPVGEHAAGRAGADDDIVERLCLGRHYFLPEGMKITGGGLVGRGGGGRGVVGERMVGCWGRMGILRVEEGFGS